MSADGRHVVFQSLSRIGDASSPLFEEAPAGFWRVYGYDRLSKTTTLLSDPRQDATDPHVSADGSRVVYRLRIGIMRRQEIVVVDRAVDRAENLDKPGNMAIEKLGSRANDLRRGYPALCEGTDCGPRISGDGSSIVFPALESPVSPELSVVAQLPGETFAEPLEGELIDFNAASPSPLNGMTPADAPVHVQLGVTTWGGSGGDLTDGLEVEGPFSAGEEECPGRTCWTSLTFDPSRSCTAGVPEVLWGRVTTLSQSPAGRTSATLTAFCGPRAEAQPAPDCPKATPEELDKLELVPQEVGNTQMGRQLTTSATVGQPFVAYTYDNSLRGTVQFSTSDCGVQLIDPGTQITDRVADTGVPNARPIMHGDVLDESTDNSNGVLYFLVQPKAVGTFAASVRTMSTQTSPSATQQLRITSRGTRPVIGVARDGEGGAFGAGPSVVASIDNSQDTIAGTEPDISADGRYVSFTSSDGPGTVASSTAVLLHDSDRRNDHTWETGATRTVSGSVEDGASASASSLSADGATVAFSKREPEGVSQVYAATIPLGTPKMLSTSASGDSSQADSTLPAVSADGTTVAFVSADPALAAKSAPAGTFNIYTRDVAAENTVQHLAGAGSALLRQTKGPHLDQHGRIIVLATPDPLIPADTNGVGDVYAVIREADAVVTPQILDLGEFTLMSAPRSGIVQVGNRGLGPLTIRSASVAGPFAATSVDCAGSVLATDETCHVTVSFTPTNAGQFDGTLSIKTGTTTEPGKTLTVSLKAAVAVSPSHPETPTTPPTTSSPSFPPTTSAPILPPVTLPQLKILPSVTRPGSMVKVNATGFPARQPVTLTWGAGGPVQVVTTDEQGRFTTYAQIPPRAATGARSVTAASADGLLLAVGEFLVQPASLQPPDFSSRS
ncbi:choice-of-anchor D domain-containing protein [Streptomyces chartreusis]|uniref:choice-of-anchor D domain-containing protein n=1 Tax=Streptomyces chartreusis TaxID=1969 RepID=UPI003418A264